jgi:endonuclease YncB( thermonuclease family)
VAAGLLESAPSPSVAQIVGTAQVTDGETIRVNGRSLRIFGVDAPELRQTCSVQGRSTPCGEQARTWVVNRVRGRQVECVGMAMTGMAGS